MAHQITDADKQRMQKFATTPKYQRSPHLLEPEAGDDDDE
ncbi:hypothetical protein HALDL1_10810 [Halobacterium sp. DL1]|jgi:hypothetical protein|nr:hypothetical protein HALDL1_10810 [Halobacterium sp. DL1]